MLLCVSLILCVLNNCFCSSVYGDDAFSNELEYTDLAPPYFYNDLRSILKFFEDPQYRFTPGVRELLSIYHQQKVKTDRLNITGQVKKHPLFVIEGLAGSGKTTIGQLLASKLNGVQVHSPSNSIYSLKPLFQGDHFKESAFNAMCHYITALEVKVFLKSSPVIMDRFWHSSASYWISYAIQAKPNKYTMPPKGNKIYTWPEDLLKPDQVFLLDVDETVRMERIFGRSEIKNITDAEVVLHNLTEFRNNILTAYKNMQNPGVIVINSNVSIPEVLDDVYSRVKTYMKI
ncbi:UMP-CMP kinase 2, mitochondrial [Diabrotica virgifera virgifera]|uniref:Thymidylate kinase-like domain-containing protein n=1 Tax=Diabrotica virgifera virgifera TaxID=50390 RepID=A0ABM5K6L0_DIAVI|nr:UMP-CMP kinase 2, mitochondrial [Diabrotica virgifera virgifera]